MNRQLTCPKCGGEGWYYGWPWVEVYCPCSAGRAAEAANRKAELELWERQQAARAREARS